MANQQQDGGSLIKVLVAGLQETSRLKMMEGLRKYITTFGLCAAPTGTSIGESMQTRRMDTKEYGKMCRRIPTLEEGRALANDARGRKVEGEKRRVTRKEKMRLREEIEVGGFHGAKRFVERCQTRECCKTE